MKIKRLVNGTEMEFDLTGEEIREAKNHVGEGEFSIEQYQRVLGKAADMATAVDDLRAVQLEPGMPFYWSAFGKCLDAIYQARDAYLQVNYACVLENASREYSGENDGLQSVLEDAEGRSMRYREQTAVDRLVEEMFEDLIL